MENKKIKVAIITNIITAYREGFYDRLFMRDDLNVTVYCQNYMPGMDFTSIHEKYGERIKIIKFISAKQEKIAWQFLPWREILKNYEVVFIGGNPRVISDLLLSTFMHFTGKKIIHWTMAHSFRANAATERIRLRWSKIFNNIFVYTDAEVKYLRDRGFKKNFITGMNNGLDQKKIDSVTNSWSKIRLNEWQAANDLTKRTLLLSCARLDAKNNFDLLIQALPAIVTEVPDLIWCVIGRGNEKGKLEKIVDEAGLSKHVRFVGAIYQEEDLAPWFLTAKLFVHPAAIGLSLLHAFGYGLPVVTHGSAGLHGPEYAAFSPELTGRNFNEGDAEHLAAVIIGLLKDEKIRSGMKEHMLKLSREEYNVDIMVERFSAMVHKVSGK